MTNGLRSVMVTLALSVMATGVGAENIPGCSASNTCSFEGVAYFAETVCSGGTCTPATTDTCPGHCTQTPEVACATDGPCNGAGNECEKDGNIPLCIAGSPRAGALCGSHGDCNDPPDDGNCQVGANFCCSGTGGPAFLGDGKIAILGSNSNTNADSVTLSTPPSGKQYVVCGRNGNDTITGGNGDDLIDGGAGTDTLNGGNGTDVIYGGDDGDTIYAAAGPYYLGGDDFVDGGAGDDDIVGSNRFLGSGGDNVILGGDGDDNIISGTGRDVVKGGAGDDYVGNTYVGIGDLPDDVVGNLLCGDDGDDYVLGFGPAHQCLDGGAGTDTCNYDDHLATSPTSKDVGTTKNCETIIGAPISGRHPSCGCEG